MRNLNDPKLLKQCKNIKNMIEIIAKDKKYENDYYAKNNHHWKLSPPIKLSEIEKFEKYAGVTLPIEYVYYLTQVGKGGVCPGRIFNDFNPEVGKNYDTLKNPSESLSEIMGMEEWEEKYGEGDFPKDGDGIMYICDMDITYLAYLIVSGPLRGHVVYLDYDCDTPPMWPKGSPDFLTWCENFYSEIIAHYEVMGKTWNFMWMQPGGVDELIKAFEEETNTEYKKDILLSFIKFDSLSQEIQDFLGNIINPEFQETIIEIYNHFNKKSKK